METNFLDNISHTPISLSNNLVNGFAPYLGFLYNVEPVLNIILHEENLYHFIFVLILGGLDDK